jgi:hypothetical protein
VNSLTGTVPPGIAPVVQLSQRAVGGMMVSNPGLSLAAASSDAGELTARRLQEDTAEYVMPSQCLQMVSSVPLWLVSVQYLELSLLFVNLLTRIRQQQWKCVHLHHQRRSLDPDPDPGWLSLELVWVLFGDECRQPVRWSSHLKCHNCDIICRLRNC